MLTFSCKCGDDNPPKIVIRGASFECAEPEPVDETMIAPLNAEAYNPEGSVIVGKRVYLTHAPVAMYLNAGITINVPGVGTGTMYVDVYADSQKIFDSPIQVKTGFTKIPRSGIKEAWRTIAAGTKLEVEVESLSAPGGYPTWRGLQVCFLPAAIANLP